MEMDSETTERFITSVERHRILHDCTDKVVMIKIARIIYGFRWQWNSMSPVRSVIKTLDFIALS